VSLMEDHSFTYCGRYVTAGIFWTGSIHHALDQFSATCDQAGMEISSKWRDKGVDTGIGV